jgi:hypothetical protein
VRAVPASSRPEIAPFVIVDVVVVVVVVVVVDLDGDGDGDVNDLAEKPSHVAVAVAVNDHVNDHVRTGISGRELVEVSGECETHKRYKGRWTREGVTWNRSSRHWQASRSWS